MLRQNKPGSGLNCHGVKRLVTAVSRGFSKITPTLNTKSLLLVLTRAQCSLGFTLHEYATIRRQPYLILNLGQNLSTICSFTDHTGDRWNSIARRSILSMKPVLLSKLARVRFLQNCLAIVIYTFHGPLVSLHTEVSTVSFLYRSTFLQERTVLCATRYKIDSLYYPLPCLHRSLQ